MHTVADAVGLNVQDLIEMKTTVWEDNSGALTLANLEPGRMTPRSKHYGVKYHWFRSHLKPNNIQVVKVDTKDQQADILTKGLRTQRFEENRKQLLGWYAVPMSNSSRSRGSVEILDRENDTQYASPGIARTSRLYVTIRE